MYMYVYMCVYTHTIYVHIYKEHKPPPANHILPIAINQNVVHLDPRPRKRAERSHPNDSAVLQLDPQ